MINKIFVKISMLFVLPVILGSISVSALANTAPIWFNTNPPEIEKVQVKTNLYDPQSILAIDVNGDGNLDVVTVSTYYREYSITWYDSSDDWNQNIISERVRISAINAGDMDGDGDLDILGVSPDFKAIYWYENGNEWAETLIYQDINIPSYVIAVDIDNDGDLDVVAANKNTDRIYWYENGNGWEQNNVTFNVNSPQEIIAVDMDGDNDLDLLSASYSDDKIAWFENGNAWNETVITTSANGIKDLEVADIDGDGDLDILATSYLDNKVSWYEKGNSWNETIIPTITEASKSVTVADMDGDGDLDVLSAPYNEGVISWYENGTSWNEHVLVDDSWSTIYIVTSDIDEDEDQDVLLLSQSQFTTRYSAYILKLEGYDTTPLINIETLDGEDDIELPLQSYDADGDDLTYVISGVDSGLFKINSQGTLSFVTTPEYHLFSDSNKDNFFELTITVSDGILSNLVNIKIELIRGEDTDNDGISNTQELIDGTDPNDYFSKIDTDNDGVPDQLEPYFSGDLNISDAIDTDGDGISDYMEWYYGDDEPPIWLAQAPNGEHWQEKVIVPETFNYFGTSNSSALGDITNDGINDIISSIGGQITVYDGSDYTPLIIDAGRSFVNFITVADLTNDQSNNPNIITAESGDGIYWYEYDTWIKRPITTSSSTYGEIILEDMDSDGDLDIVSMDYREVVWFENGNSWEEHSIIQLDYSISEFQLVDVDLDDDLDIVLINARGLINKQGLIWFENNGGWQEHVISHRIGGFEGLAVKDIDGNGLSDIVVGSEGEVVVFKHLDTWQQFRLDTLYESEQIEDVVIADINNDGLLDIAVSSNKSLIWFNPENDWSLTIVDATRNRSTMIIEDIDGDSNIDILTTENTNSGRHSLHLNINSNIVTSYRFDVPDLSPKINLPFAAFELDGQDITYSLAGNDASYFNLEGDGFLSFVSPVSIKTPIDFDGDNVFDIELIANDGGQDSVVYLTLTLIESIDTDSDGILDPYDIDDDNDLVPDTVEIAEGTDPLDASSFLDEDNNGVPDFVQKSEALYINYQFPLGVSVDEGGFSVIDLSNVTSENGPVSITLNEVQGLNYKFRDNVLYIYADYVNVDKIVNIDITLSDGIEVIQHVFPVHVMNVTDDNFKIELIKEATALSTGIRFQVVVKNIPTLLDYKWYIDGELLSSENSHIFTLKERHFQQEDLVLKVEVSADNFLSFHTDGIEVSRTSFLADVEQAKQNSNQTESTTSAENVAGSVNFISLLSIAIFVLLRRFQVRTSNRTKSFLASFFIITLSACSSTSTKEAKYELSQRQAEATKNINISLDENDPLYLAKLEYEAKEEKAKLDRARREKEIEVNKRNERIHLLTIGF